MQLSCLDPSIQYQTEPIWNIFDAKKKIKINLVFKI